MNSERSIVAQALEDLSDSIMGRYQQFGNMGDLEELILHRRHIVDLESPGIYRITAIEKLADALVKRFQHLGNIADIEEAIAHYREGVNFHSSDSRQRATFLGHLGNALFARFQRQGGSVDLGEAIRSHREALILIPLGDPLRFGSLNNLANAITTRFWHLGCKEDLTEALILRREVLQLCGPGHPGRSSALTNLSNALNTNFEQFQDVADLEQSIMYGREALKLHKSSEPNHAISLSNLSSVLATRFRRFGMKADIDEAITLQREALDRCPPGHVHRSGCLNNLAATVTTRHESTGERHDLDEAIIHLKEALQIDSPGHTGYVKVLNNLGNSYNLLFDHSGLSSDLEQAVAYHEAALGYSVPNDLDYDICLDSLANCEQRRFEQSGDVKYLEQAVDYHRRALEVRPPRHPQRARSLNNLANILITRYGQLGRNSDIEDTIACCREALDSLAADNPDQGGLLGNLATALLVRYRRSGNHLDIEEATRCYRTALGLYPDGHLGRAAILGALGNVLRQHSKSEPSRQDYLDEALALHREALDLCPIDHPSRANQLSNLGATFHSLFTNSHHLKDLQEAIRLKSAAIELLAEANPRKAEMRQSLATSILAQPDLSPDTVLTALELLQSAAHHANASSLSRLHAALKWASEARIHNSNSIMTAYSTALELLDRCLISRPTVEMQREFLASVESVPRSLASDAAASAIGLGKLERAIELLEQGRSILWTKMRGYRNPLEDLRHKNAELAEEFENASTQLEQLALSSETADVSLVSPPTQQISLEKQMQKHRTLSEQREHLLQTIRGLDGFSGFLRAVPFETLLSAASEGPLIIVNISSYRSDAIILCTAGPPVLVPLPEVSASELADLAKQLAAAQLPIASQPAKRVLPILRALWTDIVHPITLQLAELGVAFGSRIWWCPTSELCALPLHAAGPFTRGQPGLLEAYVSSYTPTVSALLRARRGLVHSPHVPRLLVIGEPGDVTLPSVQEELQIVQGLGKVVDVLVDERTRRDQVIQGLRTHEWAHFACHGHLDAEPFLSSFELHEGQRLTLLALMQAKLPSAELAVLSACHSAAGDIIGTPDETISLTAALLFCGFRSVVGTLFAMADVDGPVLAEHFYGYMFREGIMTANIRDSAKALNMATLFMKKSGVPVHRWIKFVHSGV
ncbi:hypothetical protein HWV62_13771 [Athelia sp. TMB]|nr:hypothetical protein HWV62_13771 [Athelia sp. TMB]